MRNNKKRVGQVIKKAADSGGKACDITPQLSRPQNLMSGHTLRETLYLGLLLKLKPIPDFKWNEYIHAITIVSGRIVGSCKRPRRYQTLATTLYF